ncbi:hypothetical protein VNO77_19385 [Canavalia gladiata]|uniref:Uncharacterized protein n=1 Tax=Canavalia gladiata TaxID=3824 RepID=A0AAN9LQU6_CANGL
MVMSEPFKPVRLMPLEVLSYLNASGSIPSPAEQILMLRHQSWHVWPRKIMEGFMRIILFLKGQEVQKWKVLLVMTFGNYTLIGFVSTQNLRGNVLNPSNRHIGAREAKSFCLYTLLVPAVKESTEKLAKDSLLDILIEPEHNHESRMSWRDRIRN